MTLKLDIVNYSTLDHSPCC